MKIEGLEEIMYAAASSKEKAEAAVSTLLTKPFQGPLEALAKAANLSMKEVVERLPEANRYRVDGSQFIDVFNDVAGWGDVLLIVNTEDGVFECKGPIMPGAVGMGYYNLGHGSAIAGHLRHDRCRDIYYVRRSFQGLDTCSIQFFNAQGGCMFKLFVSRREKRELDAAQVQRFEQASGLTQ